MLHAYYYYCYYHLRLHFTKRSQNDFDIVQFLFNVPFHLPFAWPFNGTQCCYDWAKRELFMICVTLRMFFSEIRLNKCDARISKLNPFWFDMRLFAIYLFAFWFKNESNVFEASYPIFSMKNVILENIHCFRKVDTNGKPSIFLLPSPCVWASKYVCCTEHHTYFVFHFGSLWTWISHSKSRNFICASPPR